jgi:hypothetical protein
MTHEEIEIGHVYAAKLGKKTVHVRIDAAAEEGWVATNIETDEAVAIASAAKLQDEVVTLGEMADGEEKKGKKPRGRKAAAATQVEVQPSPSAEGEVTAIKGKRSGKSKTTVETAPKKLSCLDAAAQVLAKAGQAMTTGEMIEAMAKKGLWSSPNGATPAATLYSAILREVNTKGDDARFVKTERGKFAARAKA